MSCWREAVVGPNDRDRLRVHGPVTIVCAALGVNRAGFYAYKQRERKPDVQRLQLKGKVIDLFNASREHPI